MQIYVIYLQLISMLEFHAIPTWQMKCQCGFSSICQMMTYVNTFCNLFTVTLMNIIFYYFIYPFDVNGFYPNPLQFIYNYFTTIIQLA